MVKETKNTIPEEITDEKEEEYQTVGEILKDARLKKKLKIEAVADKIRIRAQYLEAIENGEFGELPGPTYASGFVRTYASFLGLDANAIYDRFRDESANIGQKMSLAVMEPEEEGTSPGKKELLLALLLIVLGYGLWYAFSSYEQNKTAEEESAPVPDEAVTITVSEDSYAAEDKNAKPEVKVIETAISEPIAEEVSLPVATDASETDTVKPSETPSKAYGEDNYSSRVVIEANSETWIQVSKDSNTLISRVLAKGDKYNVPDEEGLLLRTGNAGGLDIYVDGDKIDPIGPKGTIRSGILLNADALLLR